MRRLVHASAAVAAFALLIPVAHGVAFQMDADRVVPGGGIFAPGWQGVVDKSSAAKGAKLNDSKFSMAGNVITLNSGPAAVYWNPTNSVTGDFTAKASFKEPKIMSANSHAHPYGIFIGGNKLGTDQMSLMYCSAYGTGTYIVRGFAPGTPQGTFSMGGRQPQASPAIHKADADGGVTQELGWTVKGGRAECVVNGTVVAGYDKAEVVGAGKLESLDGVVGIRISHNTDVIITGFTVTKG